MTKYYFFLLIFSSLFCTSAYTQQFSTESFDVFWKSTDKIETQKVASIEDLDSLWNSPGYNSWMGSKRAQSIFYNYYTLVFNPNLQDSLNYELEKAKGFRVTLFQHLIEAKKKKEDLLVFAKKMVGSDIIEQAKKHAFSYLPDTLSVKNDNTEIALMIFQPDAFAIPEDNVVLLDVLYAYNYGEGFEKFLGHELFHIYAAKYLSKLKPIDYNEDALIWSIDKIRNEGIADLIDKENIIEKTGKSEYDMKYIEHYQNSKQHLQAIDSLILEIAEDNSRLKELGKKVRKEIPFSGHPLGLYIAKIIKFEMGSQALLQCLENPFSFIYLYNEIANKSNRKYYVFANESIQYLKRMESEFIRE